MGRKRKTLCASDFTWFGSAVLGFGLNFLDVVFGAGCLHRGLCSFLVEVLLRLAFLASVRGMPVDTAGLKLPLKS